MPINAERRRKLFDLLPEGMPVSKAWLMQTAEIDRHAVDNLLKGGQLVPLAPAVYMRPGTRLTWMGVVAALQSIFHSDLTVGGLTALELQGFAHYLPLSGTRAVHLYGKDLLPAWLQSAMPDIRFVRRQRPSGLGNTGLLTWAYDNWSRQLVDGGTATRGQENWPFVLSSAERALLEVLMDVPETLSFEHAAQLLQGMTNLSPKRLEGLLRQCTSVKLRRLFYWLAERQGHAWFSKLPAAATLDDLGLGTGNRVLARRGRLDAKYRITVPEEMWTPPRSMTDRSDF
jgi:hypothetical protein